MLAASIQAPMPLKFDHPLDGIVVAALGVAGSEELVIATRKGRGVRWPVKTLRTLWRTGHQPGRRRPGDGGGGGGGG
ncbi:MAG: hypothetical protein M5U34_18910 [Chloroflexi bacterium]|nr:hypothetical protein [Chloroflexota bacterium]